MCWRIMSWRRVISRGEYVGWTYKGEEYIFSRFVWIVGIIVCCMECVEAGGFLGLRERLGEEPLFMNLRNVRVSSGNTKSKRWVPFTFSPFSIFIVRGWSDSEVCILLKHLEDIVNKGRRTRVHAWKLLERKAARICKKIRLPSFHIISIGCSTLHFEELNRDTIRST